MSITEVLTELQAEGHRHASGRLLAERVEAVLLVRKKLERFVDSEGYGVVSAARVIEWLDRALNGGESE